MASLKETKGRIASVSSTLKITSAMKLVASAKLRHAQEDIEAMLPYEKELRGMLALLQGCEDTSSRRLLSALPDAMVSPSKTVALVAVSSNSSLCGGFNANVIRAARNRIAEIEQSGEAVELFCAGRKMLDAMRKQGTNVHGDWSAAVTRADYGASAALAEELVQGFMDGKYNRVELIYNHFVSTSHQDVRCETYLPMAVDAGEQIAAVDIAPIMEPSPEELLAALLPRVLRLRIYTVMLDSQAAEHAARTVAMQMATDNGQSILSDLTLEYNKARQQKITSEILDIVGGSLQ